MLVLSCDLVSCINLRELLLDHHSHQAALTTVLLHPPKDTPTPSKKSSKTTPTEQDLIGVTKDKSKLVLFSSMADLEEELLLHRNLVTK